MNLIQRLSARLGGAGREKRPAESLQGLRSLLKDPAVFEQLATEGYAVIPFLEAEELAPLLKNLETFGNIRSGKSSSLFYTSGRDDSEVRKMARELSWPHVKDHIGRFVETEKAHVEGCAWLLKPPGSEGSLSPHQDSSLVDETRNASFYGWMPLQDVSPENGCVHVIPRSHLWGIHFRSLDVPWPLTEHVDFLQAYCVPVHMKAGEILLFEGALVHGSYINRTERLRAALNFFFMPKGTELCHFMRDGQTPPGKVEAYGIDMDFFYSHDYRQRPDADKYAFAGYRDFAYGPLPKKELLALLKK